MRLASCHPDRPYKAKGFCGACYQRNKRLTSDKVRIAHRKASRRWEKEHPEQRKANVRKHRYGIGPKEFTQLLIDQQGLCGICKEQKPLVIDHDHKTMQVRGLLCRSCNLALGLYEKLLLRGDVVSYVNTHLPYCARTNRQSGAWSKDPKPIETAKVA